MTLQLSEFSRNIGDVRVAVTAADALATQAATLLDLFEAHESEVRDGFSVQAGWSPYLLIEREPGVLDAAAPDFATKTPEHVGWVTDLTLALWVLTRQAAVAAALPQADAAPVGFAESVLCARGIEGAERVIMSRTTRRDVPDDSGWYLDVFPQPKHERKAEDFVRWPAYQLLGVNKHLVTALVLAEGFGAIVSGSGIDAVIDLSDRRVVVGGPL